ncbi:Rab3 GTPase-activating protein catalytic subunit [Nitzschia inconspicua]|uniref:Rab3 GTPase-activating protein catalytic subunit n=1 Tax=Nitzschia inconspicua TaxID=303405 RepID=A0A9K3KNX3_9STRA|nr:Rab3 GTPase-activating protein catalytic subunit [Nitzschia inconspicua]
MHVEEEYTDYSCSTAIERLSRDVETVLRTWHVDRGSDHHVTISESTSTIGLVSNGSISNGGAGNGNGNGGNGRRSSITRSLAAVTSGGDEEFASTRIIRSNTLTWNMTLSTKQYGRTTVAIDLELALWDAPESASTTTTSSTTRNRSSLLLRRQQQSSSTNLANVPERAMLRTSSGSLLMIDNNHIEDDDDDDEEEEEQDDYPFDQQSTLVRSLQRRPFGEMPAHDFLFDNFSTLFGIGQHITLTPICPYPIPPELVDSIAESIVKRHHPQSTARWIVANTLSGWLQTTLNIATANCHTCIPTFGVWGQYRPDELMFTGDDPTPPIPVQNNSSNESWNESNNNNYNKSQQFNSNLVGRKPSSLSSQGDGGGAGDADNIDYNNNDGRSLDGSRAGSQHDLLVGRTIQTERQQQQREMRRRQSLASNASASRNGTDRDTCHNNKNRGGVQLFPHWAQAIIKTELPKDDDDVFRWHKPKEENPCNTQFSPPFVIGHVLTPTKTSEESSRQQTRMKSKTGNQNHRSNIKNVVLEEASSMRMRMDEIASYHIGANMWVSAYSTGVPISSGPMKATAAHLLASSARLAVWAGVLLQHCPDDSMVVLTGARHVFGWIKEKNTKNTTTTSSSNGFLRALDLGRDRSKQDDSAWRMGADEDEYHHGLAAVMDLGDDEFAFYRKQCQHYAQELLEEAWGCKDRKMPLWGPSDDPVASVYATITWNGKTNDDNNITSAQNGSVISPLLTFPLRIRSQRELSPQDWAEMEQSVENTILDPTAPSRFCVQAYYDRETNVATLAASQRCVLAALIRASTLPNETLLHHLTDVNLMSLWDDTSGRQVARKIAERSRVGIGTKTIVDAMDWATAVEELISTREAEYVVHAVMNGQLTAGFPNSPEECFNEEHDLLSPFRKSAPCGRLLSVLFAHMARLRALSSVALVWRVFCQELRRRWNAKESLPNMQYVAGLDPHPLDLYEKRSFSTIGHKANFAAFLNCTEPDPDDYNCLIGQKLQVFNLGVECVVACELLENEVLENFLGAGQLPSSLNIDHDDTKVQDVPSVASTIDGATPDSMSIDAPLTQNRKWPKSNLRMKEVDVAPEKTNYGPPTIDRDLDFWVMDEPGYAPTLDGGNIAADATDDTGFDYVAPAANNLDGDDDSLERALQKKAKKHKSGSTEKRRLVVDGLPDQQWQGTVLDGNDSDESLATGTLSQAYFDAAEAGSIFSSRHGFVTLDTIVNVDDMNRRPGARCPVANAVLRITGDQVYAPYLQRPYPVTDDVALERRIMLAKSCEGEERRGALQTRLEISQRLQRPKLLSDMSAFKAANPRCTIDDFTKWYGNPGSPLDDYGDDTILDFKCYSVENALKESAAQKLDRASEAMRVLVSTRDFWGKTWEEAKPVPAAEQNPLFDYSTTVEMVLDYLEQLHPATLMNQVMAVNLSSAYFALASSAKGTMKIGIVQLSMKKFRYKTERALELLSRDATGLLSSIVEGGSTAASTNSSQYASEDTITACEDACNALSVTETMVARATSLLHKFPGQYKLISDLLRFADGSTLALIDRIGRSNFLNMVYEQQQRLGRRDEEETDPSRDNLPHPLLREYVFRNLDDENPAQLAVRFGEEGARLRDGTSDIVGGVLLALMKSNTS